MDFIVCNKMMQTLSRSYIQALEASEKADKSCLPQWASNVLYNQDASHFAEVI